MINGLYSAAAGMLGQLEQQDARANNLANSNTAGYKKVTVTFSAKMAKAVDSDTSFATGSNSRHAGVVIPQVVTSQNSASGVIERTGNITNLAIDGPGNFVVSNGSSTRLTRNGNFQVSSKGILSTPQGEMVMGQNGPIRVTGTGWSVDPDGSVKVDGNIIDKLILDRGNDAPPSSRAAEVGRVLQGELEASNVSPVTEMVAMITGYRAYEASQKAIQSIDQTLEKVINVAGRNS